MIDKTIQENQVYEVDEVAEILGVHPDTIRGLCSSGEMKCKKVKSWKILGQNIIDYLNAEEKAT